MTVIDLYTAQLGENHVQIRISSAHDRDRIVRCFPRLVLSDPRYISTHDFTAAGYLYHWLAVDRDMIAAERWVKQHAKGGWMTVGRTWFFAEDSDHLMFLLRWS